MILIYLLKVSACTALFFAVYYFLLSKLTFFNLNRFYLLLMLVLSFTIPALTIETKKEIIASVQESAAKITYSNDGFMERDFVDEEKTAHVPVNWIQILEYGYYSISAVLIFRMLLMILRIKLQLRKNITDIDGAIVLVNEQSSIKNCSFFNQIVIDSSLQPEEKHLVIKHESIHVEQLHAFDKLFANLVAAILWFNPIIYFWRNAIDDNHEFLADREILKAADKKTYAFLLLNLAVPLNRTSISSFSKFPLKNRIIMMYKEPNVKFKKLAYAAIIPVLLICCVAFVNQKEVIIEKIPVGNQNKSITAQQQNIYNMNYLGGYATLNPYVKSALKEVEPVLIIDAGHGGKDGAALALDGQQEKDLNLRAVKILKEEAVKRGIKVRLTRTTDQFLSLKDRLPMQEATAFISIHHNATLTDAEVPFNGIEVYVSKLNNNIKSAEDFGSGILSKLNKLEGIEVKSSLKDGNLFLLRTSKIPAILIELGNISDEKTLNYINEEKNMRRISNLILDGFVAFSKRGC